MKPTKITVGMASCGLASGADKVFKTICDTVKNTGLSVKVSKTGCVGICQKEPIVDVVYEDGVKITYGQMDTKEAERLVHSLAKEQFRKEKALWNIIKEENVIDGKVKEYEKPAYGREIPELGEYPYFKRQKKIALRNCGVIDPEKLEDYLSRGGYSALQKTVKTMQPEGVIKEVTDSGLRGRGGAGFSTGTKWGICRKANGETKYVICNADEGDPGAFMDRSILESDPHSVIEGMIIGGYAVGAEVGYIYVRTEYPLAIKRIETAINQARKHGALGKDIFGSGYNFNIKIRKGAGAFVCGEETALLSSIEGTVGEPKPKPPYPAINGLWNKPTVINNVKTWANIAPIITRGSKWFSSIGSGNSKGTAVFSLVGNINYTGLVEVPMGITLREMIYEVGGGIPNGKRFKAVQTGGPSGGCIPEKLLDLHLDYEELTKAGSMMGSGGMIVVDEDTCMVDLARFFITFTTDESCGKCTPCREGTKRMLELLDDIVNGNARKGDLELLKNMAELIKETSLCGLGKTAPNPVLTTMKYFPEEYKAHMKKQCPAKVCRALIKYKIDQDICTNCKLCVKECPVDAIPTSGKKVKDIVQEKCIKCGACKQVCKFNAVKVE